MDVATQIERSTKLINPVPVRNEVRGMKSMGYRRDRTCETSHRARLRKIEIIGVHLIIKGSQDPFGKEQDRNQTHQYQNKTNNHH